MQCGTNLSTLDIFPTLELWLGKPMIPINVATIWHALRASGVHDHITGKGRLLEEILSVSGRAMAMPGGCGN